MQDSSVEAEAGDQLREQRAKLKQDKVELESEAQIDFDCFAALDE